MPIDMPSSMEREISFDSPHKSRFTDNTEVSEVSFDILADNMIEHKNTEHIWKGNSEQSSRNQKLHS